MILIISKLLTSLMRSRRRIVFIMRRKINIDFKKVFLYLYIFALIRGFGVLGFWGGKRVEEEEEGE